MGYMGLFIINISFESLKFPLFIINKIIKLLEPDLIQKLDP